MTEEDTRKLLYTINTIYPNFKTENPEQTIKVWMDFLEDMDPVAIGASLKVYVRNNTTGFAPSIGQLIQGAYDLKNRAELNASDAWNLVYKAICRSTYYAAEEFAQLPEEIRIAVGSPAQLRAWASDSQFNEAVASSNFRRAYATACERKRSEALLPESIKKLFTQRDIKRLEREKDELHDHI